MKWIEKLCKFVENRQRARNNREATKQFEKDKLGAFYKPENKSIIREIFESYKVLPEYESAIIDIYYVITGMRTFEGFTYMTNKSNALLLNEILGEISRLKSRLNELENRENDSSNCCKNTPSN